MRPRLLSLVAFSLTASAMTVLPPATAGDLYKWTDDKGRVHYSSTPPPESAKKAATLDSRKLSNINALPNDPHKDRADGGGPNDDSNASEPETPIQTASSDSAPASPPVLIPPSLLPPSNPPTAAKPEQPAQPDIVEVVAQGMGIDANAALLNAYSNAVQQALGLYVDAETMVQNDQIVQDKILTYSKGFIQEATTVKQSQANGLFQVNIRAKVKRQQLLEQAKANNISVKAVEGVSLHAQVETQIKQESDAKALLEKALLPLIGETLLRADLAPSTQDQPNPIINKEGSNEQFVTLDYRVQLSVDESLYYNYVKNDLIPVLNSLATRKGEFSMQYKNEKRGDGRLNLIEDNNVFKNEELNKDNVKVYSVSVLVWKDKGFSSSKWNWFYISKDYFSKWVGNDSDSDRYKSSEIQRLCNKSIDLSLLDQKNEIVALGNQSIDLPYGGNSNNKTCVLGNSGIAGISILYADKNSIRISPYFGRINYDAERLLPMQIATISVKILREDIPRVKNIKMEVKPTGGN